MNITMKMKTSSKWRRYEKWGPNKNEYDIKRHKIWYIIHDTLLYDKEDFKSEDDSKTKNYIR